LRKRSRKILALTRRFQDIGQISQVILRS